MFRRIKMKKIISMIIAVAMCLSFMTCFVSAASARMSFKDVKAKNWFYSPVRAVWEEGIMKGMSETTFAPNGKMTRAELVTILYRLADAPDENYADNLIFKDVKKTAWYADYLGWAVKEGLVNGYWDNTFRPNAPVLRQELAKLFSAFIDYAGYEISGNALIESFADAAKHPEWAKAYIEDLRVLGLIGGDQAGKFNPQSTATRAEVAAIITRLLSAVYPEDPATPEELLVGTWIYSEDILASMDEASQMLFQNGDLVAHYILVFTEDGKYEMTLDEDSLRRDFENLKVVFRANMKNMLQEIADMYGITPDELVAEEGYSSVNAYLDEVMAEMDVEELIAALTIPDAFGVYEVEGDKIYIIGNGYEKDDDDAASFSVDKYKLTITFDGTMAFERA